jgi:hopanoid biosynthesis associated protein HpnK
LAEEVNAAVEAAHRSGILSAASLMVGGPAVEDALRRARRLPRLRVGLHVVLVEGAPVSRPDQIPDLVDRSGRLRCDLARLGLELACRPAVRRQLRAEIEAQFARYRRTGLALDHVDAHKHYHLHPIVAGEIIRAGRGYGMRALRVPAEPWPVLRQAAGAADGVSSRLLSLWASWLRRQARRAGLVTPDAVFGLAWSGALSEERLVRLLPHLPSGLIEIYTHPAVSDRFPGHCPGYRYVDELNALRAPNTIAALRHSGFRLGSYADAPATA